MTDVSRKRYVKGFRHHLIFYYSVELGSQSAAARQLKLSPPTVSQAICEFEVMVGALLFRKLRGHQKSEPTRAAIDLHRRIKPHIEALIAISKDEGFDAVRCG